MLNVEYCEAISETLDILEHTKKEDVNKISSKFMEFLRENASKTYKPNLNHTKKIKDMHLKNETKILLSIIYKKFWCNSDEQDRFEKILIENQLKREQKAREKYNPNNLFKDANNSNNSNHTETINSSSAMIEYKETFFERIVKKIKNIFRIK